MTTRARSLRADQTDAERLLWAHLRRNQLGGAHFRRQQPLGRYVADFYCHRAALVIELDGSQHLEATAALRDRKRDQEFAKLGVRVLRFADRDVLTRLPQVLALIHEQVVRANPLP